MERLTERSEQGTAMVKGCGSNCKYGYEYCRKEDWENCKTIDDVIDTLADYEDAEEQGLLLRLPCKVGDTLYRIDTDDLENAEIEICTVENIVISKGADVLFKYDAYDGVICALENLTKGSLYLGFYRVFLTKEEAEQALADMKGV